MLPYKTNKYDFGNFILVIKRQFVKYAQQKTYTFYVETSL